MTFKEYYERHNLRKFKHVYEETLSPLSSFKEISEFRSIPIESYKYRRNGLPATQYILPKNQLVGLSSIYTHYISDEDPENFKYIFICGRCPFRLLEYRLTKLEDEDMPVELYKNIPREYYNGTAGLYDINYTFMYKSHSVSNLSTIRYLTYTSRNDPD